MINNSGIVRGEEKWRVILWGKVGCLYELLCLVRLCVLGCKLVYILGECIVIFEG